MSDRVARATNPASPDQVAEVIRGRRSVANFRPERPDVALIRAAVEAARWAPNHHLTNPWRFYILGEQTRAAVIALNTSLVEARRGESAAAAKDKRWRKVPGWLVVTCRKSDDELVAREDYAATACAIQNLMLYLHSAGVATKWTTGAVTRADDFYRICDLDATQEYCAGLLWYGYAAKPARPTPRHAVDDILFQRN